MFFLGLCLSVGLFWTCGPIAFTKSIKPSMIMNILEHTCFNRTSSESGHVAVNTMCAEVIHSSRRDRESSEKICQHLGGHLISITSLEENKLIGSLIDNTTEKCWIGRIGALCEDSWADGSNLQYTKWSPNERGKHTACCVEIYGQAISRKRKQPYDWNFHECEKKLPCFICGTMKASANSHTATTLILETITESSNDSRHKGVSADALLLSPVVEMTVIVLVCIFFLTTVGLTIGMLRLNRSQVQSKSKVYLDPVKNNALQCAGPGDYTSGKSKIQSNAFCSTQPLSLNASHMTTASRSVVPTMSITYAPSVFNDQSTSSKLSPSTDRAYSSGKPVSRVHNIRNPKRKIHDLHSSLPKNGPSNRKVIDRAK